MKHFIIALLILAFALSSEAAFASLSQTQVSQLYVSIFGRASEGEGNAYWSSEQDNMTIAADTMLITDAAKAYFGSTLNDNQAFIEFIYENTLSKTIADDSAGIDYWVGELNKGNSRGQVVASLIAVIKDYAPGGPYYNPVDAATVAAFNQFTNRVTVSNYMADLVQFNPEGWETATSFSSGLIVTNDPNTVDTAKLMIDDMIQDGQYDNDSDGYSENQGDCNDSNNSIYPGAGDVCEDGIDQDCDGVDSVCQQLWIGDWIQVNFLGTDESGYPEDWGSDDPTGIGFVANVSKDEWIERDEYGNGCAVVYAYTVNGDRYSMKGKSTTCPYFGDVTEYTDAGRLEFLDNNTMILWYDYPPGAPDEIIAFKWKRK